MTVCYGLSLILSLASWRYKGDLFVVISIALQAVVVGVIYNWHSPSAAIGSVQNLTNGPFGIANIPQPSLGGYQILRNGELAAISLLLLFVGTVATSRITSSSFGKFLECIRDDEIALRSLGKNTRLWKVHAFGFSCMLAGLAGALYAAYARYVDPSIASLDESVVPLAMALMGGLGSRAGPILGAFILLIVPELLRLLALQSVDPSAMRLLVYGVFLIVLVHLRPQGIVGKYRFD